MARDRPRSSRAALQAARDAFKTLNDDRERFRRVGLGPGESYVGLWRICADHLEIREAIRRKLASDDLKASERRLMMARHDLLQEQLVDILRFILPFERPKLSPIEVSGDQLNPARVKPDLTKLTDEELGQLEKIVLKVGTGASGGPDGNAG
jgi:hypothetical protein